MSWLSKGLKKAGKVGKKVFKGVKKAASVANPLFGAAYDAIGGKGAKEIGRNYVQNNLDGAKVAAIGAVGQAALPALAGAGGAGGAASTAGAAGKMGALGKVGSFLDSPLGAAGVDLAGNVIAGIGQGRIAEKDRREQGRQFDLEYGLQKRQLDMTDEERLRRRQKLDALAPMREEIMRLMAQRFGITLPQGPQGAPGQGMPAPAPAPGQSPGMGGDPSALMRERLRSLLV